MKVVRRTSSYDKTKMLRRSYQQYVNNEKIRPMSTTEHGIQKEIAIMKKCYHPNLVRLFEVIDDPRQEKIYISEYSTVPVLGLFATLPKRFASR